MILDFNFKGKYVVVVGGGAESYRKILSFLNAGSKVLVVSKNFVVKIWNLHRFEKVDLLEYDVTDAKSFVNLLGKSPDLLVAVTDDSSLNLSLVDCAKSAGFMAYSVDNPEVSDFMFPALAKLGDVNVAVSTNGKSPTMARVLRQRIEKMITKEDLLQIQLQDYVRQILKQRIPEQKLRKIVLSEIVEDNQIKKLLESDNLQSAKTLALDIAESFVDKNQVLQEV